MGDDEQPADPPEGDEEGGWEVLPPESNEDEQQDNRTEELSNKTALSEATYAQALEDSVAHAMLARPAVPAANVRSWFPTGPRNIGGRITALAQDPTNPQVIYAGSAHGGLWRSVDGGDTWTSIGPRDLSVPIGAIAIPDGQPHVLYVGTGSHKENRVSGRGIFKVSVGGPLTEAGFGRLVGSDPPTTPPLNATPGAAYRYHAIAIDPDDPTQFWAASQTGLWKFNVRAEYVPAPSPTITTPPATVVDATTGGNVAPVRVPRRDFPPPTPIPPPLPPGIALSAGPIPLPGDFRGWPQYATDVTVCRDPNSTATWNGVSRYLLVYVAVFGFGVFRARYDRSTDLFDGAGWTQLIVPNPALTGSTVGRVRLAQCRDQPKNIYAVFSQVFPPGPPPRPPITATVVYSSNDAGNSWVAGGPLPAGVNTGQADYDLVLAVNPSHPRLLICGVVELAKSEDGGATWTQIADYRYDMGDHSQHSDQHAAMFDAGDRRRVWIGNDGGLQTAPNVHEIQAPTPLRFWRKRSHGLNASQAQSTAVNSAHPFMGGIGLQDNGSWWGLGGPTWYRVNWADGGGLAFHSGDPRRIYPAQNNGFNVSTVVPAAQPAFIKVPMAVFRGIVSPMLPETSSGPVAPGAAPGTMEVRLDWSGLGGPFVPIVEEDPITAGRVLLGSLHNPTAANPNQRIAFRAGPYNPLPTPLPVGSIVPTPAPTRINMSAAALAAIPAGAACSAIAFGPMSAGNVDVWIGASTGHLLVSTAGVGGVFAPAGAAIPNASGLPQSVSSIAVHPRNSQIVAVAVIPNARSSTPTATVVTIRITASGPLGGAATRFSYQVGTAAAVPNNPVQARFAIPNTVLTVLFGPGQYSTPDQWTITTAAVVAAVGATTSTGAVTARNWFGGRVFLTFNKGAAWTDVTETFAGPAPATHSLPPSPIPSLLFDPTPPPGGTPNAPTRLFAGTLAGVYAMQSVPSVAPAPGAAVAVDWQPFNERLPLALVTDMRVVPRTNRIRIGTYGRGMYEIDLSAAAAAGATPNRRLFIRQTVIEDGRSYPRQIPFALRDDPRLPAGTLALDFAHAFDIRVDASPFDFFDDRVDGVEFEQQLGVDLIRPGARNNVYVQIHNSGLNDVINARVHLFFCVSAVAVPLAAPGPAPGAPPAFLQPALPGGMNLGPIADFYRPAANFQPPAGARWQRVAPARTVARVTPGEPVVVRFEWERVPVALAGGNVALLALVDAPADHGWSGTPANMDALIRSERRVALRICPVAPRPPASIFVRDGVDDSARTRPEAVAFGGRSPDIIVRRDALPGGATPTGTFKDLLDLQASQRAKRGQVNRVFVRVHNRGLVDTTAVVELFAIPVDADNQPDFDQTHWIAIVRPGAPAPPITVAVPAGKFAVTDAVEWTPPAPAAPPGGDVFLILALVGTQGSNDDPAPLRSRMTAAAFWNVLTRHTDSENAASRAVRVEP